MISKFCQYLYDIQKIADDSNIIVEARHFDVLDYYFKSNHSPKEAFKAYCKFRKRIYALEHQVLPTHKELKPLVEMESKDFDKIFGEGFTLPFKELTIEAFNSLYGFHNAIATYGKFESHRLAVELGYDVEFTLHSYGKP